MQYYIGEQVYMNGNITTNRFPRGNIGVNDIKNIFATNIRGIVHEIELPSMFNANRFLYTIKIFENLYAIEVTDGKLSRNPHIGQFGFLNPPNPVYTSNPLNPLNPLTDVDQFNELNKLNFINSQINSQNMYNQNLNTSKSVQKTISKYYYYKLVDEWLYKKLFSLLAFVEIVNGKPQLIKSMNRYSVERLATETDDAIEARAEYLEKNIITKKLVKQILKKIVKNMCFNWYDLNKHENTISKVFLEYLKELLETSINEYNK